MLSKFCSRDPSTLLLRRPIRLVFSCTTRNSLRRFILANYGSHSVMNCFFILPEIKVVRGAWRNAEWSWTDFPAASDGLYTFLFGGEQKSLIELFKLSLFCLLFFPLVWQFLFDFTVSWPICLSISNWVCFSCSFFSNSSAVLSSCSLISWIFSSVRACVSPDCSAFSCSLVSGRSVFSSVQACVSSDCSAFSFSLVSDRSVFSSTQACISSDCSVYSCSLVSSQSVFSSVRACVSSDCSAFLISNRTVVSSSQTCVPSDCFVFCFSLSGHSSLFSSKQVSLSSDSSVMLTLSSFSVCSAFLLDSFIFSD